MLFAAGSPVFQLFPLAGGHRWGLGFNLRSVPGISAFSSVANQAGLRHFCLFAPLGPAQEGSGLGERWW